jgi:hypothetical protein
MAAPRRTGHPCKAASPQALGSILNPRPAESRGKASAKPEEAVQAVVTAYWHQTDASKEEVENAAVGPSSIVFVALRTCGHGRKSPENPGVRRSRRPSGTHGRRIKETRGNANSGVSVRPRGIALSCSRPHKTAILQDEFKVDFRRDRDHGFFKNKAAFCPGNHPL